MKAPELRDMTVDELQRRERELYAELLNLRFRHATNQLENPMRLPLTRKDLARVKTLIQQKLRTAQGAK